MSSMTLIDDYIDAATLTGYTRAALADLPQNRFRLARFLPHNPNDDILYEFTRGGAGLTEAASFRAYDTESPIGSREGVTKVKGELPPISRKIRLGERDRLRLRQAGNDAYVAAIYRDAMRLARQIEARLELARGAALVTGKVAIAENGLVLEADFGRSGSHTVSAGTAWTNTSGATVLSDLVSWVDTYTATNGEPPGVIEASTRIARLMEKNAEVINAIVGSTAGRSRVNREELNALLESESLPPIEVNDEQVKLNGSTTRVIADDKLLLLPAPGDPNDPESTDLGATVFGTTAESLEPEYGIEAGEEPGIVAGSYKSVGTPITLWTEASAISMPVLANPDLSFCADVA